MEADASVQLTTAREGDVAVVRACGELDFATTEALLDSFRSVSGAGVTRCALDCERVTFIDSEAVKALLSVRTRLLTMGIRLEVRSPSKQVRRVLDLLGLDNELQSR